MKLFVMLKAQPVELKHGFQGSGSALEMFRDANYEDDCSDANLKDVVVYLRGCTGLRIPAHWRPLLPTEL